MTAADIRTILCPVDFSESSEHAIEQAIYLAAWLGASVTALHVCESLFTPIPGLPSPEDRLSPGEVERARERLSVCFAAAAARGVPVEVLVDVGRPARAILDRAAVRPAGLIAMGTHGAGGFERLVLGSVAEKVLRKAPCPVLTVPPRAQATSTLPFRHLLCAVDFSEASVDGVALACALAAGANASVTFVHVLEWPWQEPPPPSFDELPPAQAHALVEFRQYATANARRRLEALAVRHQGACAAVVRVGNGKAHAEILRIAEEERPDVIVMGVHGRSAVDLMVLGSTTNQVVRHASCPVLTIKR